MNGAVGTRAVVDGIGEASRGIAAGPGETRAAADGTACSGVGASADLGS
ncbi:hypothetical protein SNL152K_1027 [Streptomyces sp. NL15-2K]|nr:hypothetical protein SNL152K_1027 [Streptomyces sp. NL15-2K]